MGITILVIVLVIIYVLTFFFAKTVLNLCFGMAIGVWNAGVVSLCDFLLNNGTVSGIPGFDTVYDIVYATVLPFANALVLCLAFAEIGKSMTNMLDMKRWETVIKALIRIVIVDALMLNGLHLISIVNNDIFLALAQNARGRGFTLDNEIYGFLFGDAGTADSVADSIEAFCNSIWNDATQGFRDFDSTWDGSFNAVAIISLFTNIITSAADALLDVIALPIAEFLVALIGGAIALFIVIGTIVDVGIVIITRFIRLAMHVLLWPIGIATFASSETSFVGKQYAKSFCAIGLENVFTIVILRIFPDFLKLFMQLFSLGGIGTGFLGNTVGQFIGSVIGFCIGFSALKTLIKSVDQFTAQMIGLGGA